jgi:guanylate kinase
VIDDRLDKARAQLAEAGDFDHMVENDDRSRAAEALAAIVSGYLGSPATMARP